MARVRAIDLFSGIGGSSWGAHLGGAEIVAAFDAWKLAGDVHKDNFPSSRFYHGYLEDLDVDAISDELGKIDLILASPECTNHGPAKGNRPRCETSKNTAFQVTRFASAFKPRWIVVENVSAMRNWKRYDELLNDLTSLGYKIRSQVLNSADFGVPQRRRRLFLMCDLEREPAEVVSRSRTAKTAKTIIDVKGSYKSSPLRAERRALATLGRADLAIETVGKNSPFLLVYYGSDAAGGWQRLDVPLRTVTTLDRFALVTPSAEGHVMRMLQVPELQLAMGMPRQLKLQHGSRRDRVRLLGNAVCPPVMTAVVRALTGGRKEPLVSTSTIT